MNKWIVAALCACAPLVINAAEEPTEGLAPFEPGDGVTAIVRGVLTPESFKVESVRVVGARLAGRAANPDQFRMMLLDAEGRNLGLVSTWSPLLSLEWVENESTNIHVERVDAERLVDIFVPASISLESVALGWPEGKEIARVSVGQEIRRFCEGSPENPACGGKREAVSYR